MKPLTPITAPYDPAVPIDPESRYAWELWKKIIDFSEYLWNAYEYGFLSLPVIGTFNLESSYQPRRFWTFEKSEKAERH